MKPGDLVQANKFANWSTQQAKVLPACHFEVINASR